MRGKKFRSVEVHSMLKKRLAKEELLNRQYPLVWSDFSMKVVEKTILMNDFRFPKGRGENKFLARYVYTLFKLMHVYTSLPFRCI